MVGAVVCADCGAAAVVPSQPLEQAAPWHCRACGHAHAAASIHSMLTGGAAVVQCPVELETKVKRRFRAEQLGNHPTEFESQNILWHRTQ